MGDDGGEKPPQIADWRTRRQSRIRQEPAVSQGITFVGLDAHKKSISVAMLLPGQEKPVEWQVANEPGAVKRMVRKIEREAPGEVRCCYEAGPCGYALQRQITDAGEMSCMVVAPSLIPRKPGERIKTDRRDARKLAELFRAGLLTEVQPPTEADEAARDLCRAREDAREDIHRCQHRLSKLLLRRGIVYTGKRNWSKAYRAWLKEQRFESVVDQAVFNDYLLAVEQVETRHEELVRQIEELSGQAPYAEPVAALRCFRGIDTITAMTIVTELHGFARFTSPRGLMAYLGLVPSEHSSSDSKRRGSITKTGNGHVRRVMVEASWSYRHRPQVPKALRKRRRNQPAAVIAIADKAMLRLYRRFQRMTAKGKPTPKAVTAVARELVGFIWAVLYPLSQKAAA
jgi:transposase